MTLLTQVTKKGQRNPPELRVPAKIAFHLFNDKKLKEKLKDVNLPITGKRKVNRGDTADEAVPALAVEQRILRLTEIQQMQQYLLGQWTRKIQSHGTYGIACITSRCPTQFLMQPVLCYIPLSQHWDLFPAPWCAAVCDLTRYCSVVGGRQRALSKEKGTSLAKGFFGATAKYVIYFLWQQVL